VDCQETSCCGMSEICGLDGVKAEQIKSRTAIAKAVGWWSEGGYDLPTNHCVIATTNERQVAAARELKKAGYRRVTTWRNGNSGNRVTLWYKILK
jgi:hypothetical protein